ncbi:hypothetical protein DOTSEDRAFT_58433 [Dothistroma septosporum NZE10]|uniref:NmrA-like domain-containing protein n=1 Tax=Dothistroma septosporum (strain NZE10 / CBS 128990) TaxID=675120 RepID=N1Q3G1_DOTSN|nr:hypothetical protein DOTSEDRAFT_58433 [Dothistroma septosporum NZE10]
MLRELVVACPSGKQCTHLLPLLVDKGIFQLRLAAHTQNCRELLHSGSSVWHVEPSFHSRENDMGPDMVDAAHELKSYVEERLVISPLNWTIIEPTNAIIIERLWTSEFPTSVTALRDDAEASTKILSEGPKHYFAEHPLCLTLMSRNVGIGTPSFEVGTKKLQGYVFGGRLHHVYAEGAAPGAIDEDFAYAAKGDPRGDICKDEGERLVLFGIPNVL